MRIEREKWARMRKWICLKNSCQKHLFCLGWEGAHFEVPVLCCIVVPSKRLLPLIVYLQRFNSRAALNGHNRIHGGSADRWRMMTPTPFTSSSSSTCNSDTVEEFPCKLCGKWVNLFSSCEIFLCFVILSKSSGIV